MYLVSLGVRDFKSTSTGYLTAHMQQCPTGEDTATRVLPFSGVLWTGICEVSGYPHRITRPLDSHTVRGGPVASWASSLYDLMGLFLLAGIGAEVDATYTYSEPPSDSNTARKGSAAFVNWWLECYSKWMGRLTETDPLM